MKHKVLLLSVIFGLALPAIPSIASEHDSGAMQPDAPKEVKPKAKKKVKPHSHLEEKTGVPAKTPEESKPDSAVSDADKKQQHLHPRDGK